MAPSDFFRATHSGIELFVRLTPHASRDAVAGIEAGPDRRQHLAARVRAIPDKGKANAALEKLVAAWLDVRRTRVSVSAGFTQRLKTLRIEGDPAELTALIQTRVQGLGKAVISG